MNRTTAEKLLAEAEHMNKQAFSGEGIDSAAMMYGFDESAFSHVKVVERER